jgi:cytochrome c-type biogenesis protein CcmE
MTELDEELKKALEESEASATAADSPTTETTAPDASKRNLGLLFGLLVMCGAILVFVLGQDSDELSYAKKVHEVVGQEEALGERNLRVQGVLVHGSLSKREEPCEFRFKIRSTDAPDDAPLEVRYAACIVPDTFRDVKGMDVEVTAEGKLSGSGYLEAKHIFAKCPSKYEMQQRQAAGEQAPHSQGKPELNPMDIIPGGGQGS